MESKTGNLGFTANFKSGRVNSVSDADRRSLRAHRKSIEWRHRRDMSVNLRRNIESQESADEDDSVPVQAKRTAPNHEDDIPEKVQTSKQVQKKEEAKFSRRDKLAEWRRQKEVEKLKKKIDDKEKKKLFLVTKTQASSLPVSTARATKNKTDSTLPKSKSATTSTSTISTRRVTRSSSVVSSSGDSLPKTSHQGRKPPMKRAVTKDNKDAIAAKGSKLVLPTVKPNAFDVKPSTARTRLPTKSKPATIVPKATKPEAAIPMPTRMTRSRSTTGAVKNIPAKTTQSKGGPMSRSVKTSQTEKPTSKRGATVKRSASTPKATTTPKTEEFPALTPAKSTKITLSRGECNTSFAPSDFKFTVPSTVSTFQFKPLSPNSAANFMFPGEGQKQISPITNTQMSSTPIINDTCSKLIHSPVSSIKEPRPADTTDENKEKTAVAPVMVLATADAALSSPACMSRRRSSRRSVSRDGKSDGESEAMDTKDPTNQNASKPAVATPGKRRSRRRSSVMETDSESSSQNSQADSDTEETKKSRRRSSRRVSDQQKDSQSNDSDDTNKKETSLAKKEISEEPNVKTPRRRSRRLSADKAEERSGEARLASDKETPMEAESTQSDSQNSDIYMDSESTQSDSQCSESEPAAEQSGSNLNKSKRRRSRRTSRFTSSLPSVELEPVKEVSEPNSPTVSDIRTGKNTGSGVNAESLSEAISEVKSSHLARNERLANMDDSVFVTPSATVKESARRQRTKSMSAILSAERSGITSGVRSVPRNNRTSLILRTLSPEEGIEVLKNSPMIELSRGKSSRSISSNQPAGSVKSSPGVPILDFGDADDILLHEGEKDLAAQSQTELLVKCLKKIESPELKTDHPAMDTNDVCPENDNPESTVAEEIHDVPYFRKLINVHTEKLTKLCDEWDQIKVQDAGILKDKVDVIGQLDTVIGQAQLMMGSKGRFKQFGDLVDNCEFGRGEKETTCQDLQGFWDMVYYQIEDVTQKFEDLSSLRLKEYVIEKPKPVKKVIKKTVKAASKPKAPPTKSRFAEFRAKVKQQAASGSENVVTQLKQMVQSPVKPVLHLEPEAEIKTMEFGFFKVCSPVRNPAPHCDGSTSKSLLSLGSKPNTPAGSPLLHSILHKAARGSAHGPSPLLLEGEKDNPGPSPLLRVTAASPMIVGTPKTGSRRKSSVTTLFSQTSTDTSETCQKETAVVSGTPVQHTSIRKSLGQDMGRDLKALEQPPSQESQPMECENTADEPHDVPYFRKLIKTQTEKLTKFCEEWELIKSEDVDVLSSKADMMGQLDTVIGQAQLMMGNKGRFKQFGDLVDNCEFGRGEKETTCQDLQGFWDMVYYQIEDVIIKFEDLTKLRANQWVSDKPKTQPIKKVVKKTTKAAKPKAPAVKSKFAAFRSQLKKQKSENEEESKPSADVPSKSPVPVLLVLPEEEVKTFEAGFFCVSSPVRSPAVHCEGGTPRRSTSRPTTPAASPFLRTVVERAARRSLHGPSPLLKDTTSSLGTSPLVQDSSATTPRGTKRKSVYLMSFDSPKQDLDSSPSKRRRSEETKENIKSLNDKSLFSPEPSGTQPSSARSRRRSTRKSTRLVTFAAEPTEIDTNVQESPNKNEDSFSRYLVPSQMTDNSVSDSPVVGPRETENEGLLITPPDRAGGVHTPTEAFSKLRVEYTPGVGKPTHAKRGSEMLYTPPSKLATPDESEKTFSLMSFSPVSAYNDASSTSALDSCNQGTPSARGSRRSTRLSLM